MAQEVGVVERLRRISLWWCGAGEPTTEAGANAQEVEWSGGREERRAMGVGGVSVGWWGNTAVFGRSVGVWLRWPAIP